MTPRRNKHRKVSLPIDAGFQRPHQGCLIQLRCPYCKILNDTKQGERLKLVEYMLNFNPALLSVSTVKAVRFYCCCCFICLLWEESSVSQIKDAGSVIISTLLA